MSDEELVTLLGSTVTRLQYKTRDQKVETTVGYKKAIKTGFYDVDLHDRIAWQVLMLHMTGPGA